MVGHIDGDESNTVKENLAWTCRPCNSRVAVNMKRVGIGRRTKQYNPGKKATGAKSAQEFGLMAGIMRGDIEGDPAVAARIIAETPPKKRSRFVEEIWEVRKKLYGPSGRKDGGSVPF